MYRGNTVAVRSITLKAAVGSGSPSLDAQVVFINDKTQAVHGHIKHEGVPLTSIPGAEDATRELLAAIERWLYSTHYTDNPKAGELDTEFEDHHNARGIMETLKGVEQG